MDNRDISELLKLHFAHDVHAARMDKLAANFWAGLGIEEGPMVTWEFSKNTKPYKRPKRVKGKGRSATYK